MKVQIANLDGSILLHKDNKIVLFNDLRPTADFGYDLKEDRELTEEEVDTLLVEVDIDVCDENILNPDKCLELLNAVMVNHPEVRFIVKSLDRKVVGSREIKKKIAVGGVGGFLKDFMKALILGPQDKRDQKALDKQRLMGLLKKNWSTVKNLEKTVKGDEAFLIYLTESLNAGNLDSDDIALFSDYLKKNPQMATKIGIPSDNKLGDKEAEEKQKYIKKFLDKDFMVVVQLKDLEYLSEIFEKPKKEVLEAIEKDFYLKDIDTTYTEISLSDDEQSKGDRMLTVKGTHPDLINFIVKYAILPSMFLQGTNIGKKG